jgi:hypothetical protein
MLRTRNFAFATFAAALVATLGLSNARAADAPPTANDAAAQVKAALAAIEAAETAKDEAALSAAIKPIAPLYKSTQDEALKGSMMSALGKVVKQAKMTTARGDALKTMIATEDGKEAWKAIQGDYPSNDSEDATHWDLTFLGALHDLHPDGAIDKLLESFQKGKHAEFAAAAVAALGGYHKSKQREDILEKIVKTGKIIAPSRAPGKVPTADAQGRWATISAAVGKALDELTGSKIGDTTDWFRKVDEAKKNYKQFFKD